MLPVGQGEGPDSGDAVDVVPDPRVVLGALDLVGRQQPGHRVLARGFH